MRLSLSLFTAVLMFTAAATAQGSANCKPSSVIPLANREQSPADVVVDPPLPDPLASRGVVIINYCAENLRILPLFGPKAAEVSPRVGHIHVSLDDAPWVWADASGNPIILQGLPSGPHKVRIDLVDANHHPLANRTIAFVVPAKSEQAQHH